MAFDLDRLRAGIKPFRLHWFAELTSTSDHAMKMRRADELFAPALVVADRQTAGRGRGSHSWWSGEGNLTATFAMPVEAHFAPHHVPLIAGLAVRAAAAEVAGTDEFQLKWPNDLLFDGRKVAGLLCERVLKVDLIGVGLNVNSIFDDAPEALRDRVASLRTVCGMALDLTDVLETLARHLYRRLSSRDEPSFAASLKEYDRYHALLGRRVTVSQSTNEPAVTGICQGLDDTGRLLLQDRQTLHRVIAGQVSFQ